MEVTVVIRFKNEERYIGAVLQAVMRQRFPEGSYEILAVDNCSTDQSKRIAEGYNVNVIQIDDYRPGFALNTAIKHSEGKYIAVLSAHTIPANDRWLETLYNHMSQKGLLGVYGAQQYPTNTRFLSKCVLDRFSTLESRIETADSDFWNANSMFSRDVWEQQPFNEEVFELEDHYWTKQLLPLGFHVIFEPRALVYHYSHLKRLDRTHLPVEDVTAESRISGAIRDLEDSNASWPIVMRAGLTLSSLSHVPKLREAVDAIGNVFSTHSDFDLRWRLAYILGKIPNERSVQYLVKGLTDPSLYPRDAVVWSLGRLKTLAVDTLLEWLDNHPERDASFAALSLALTQEVHAVVKAIKCLVSELRSDSLERRLNAVYAAGEIADLGITNKLLNELNEQLEEIPHQAELRAVCWAIGCHAHFGYPPLPSTRLRDLSKTHPDPLVRFEATVALGKLALNDSSPKFIQPLFEALSDSHSRVRYGAVQSLRLISEWRELAPLPSNLELLVENDFGCAFELNLMHTHKS